MEHGSNKYLNSEQNKFHSYVDTIKKMIEKTTKKIVSSS